MCRLTLDEILIGNLKGDFSPSRDRMVYMSKENAYQTLKRYTGQDFGWDVQAWEKWFRENSDEDAWKGLRNLRENEDGWESPSSLGV